MPGPTDAALRAPLLLFNCDGDSVSLAHFEPPITAAQLCRPIDELSGTAVNVFIHCLNRGDDTFSHRTKVAEVYGENVDSWDLPVRCKRYPDATRWAKAVAGMKRIADNTKAIRDVGPRPWGDIHPEEQHGLRLIGRRLRDCGG